MPVMREISPLINSSPLVTVTAIGVSCNDSCTRRAVTVISSSRKLVSSCAWLIAGLAPITEAATAPAILFLRNCFKFISSSSIFVGDTSAVSEILITCLLERSPVKPVSLSMRDKPCCKVNSPTTGLDVLPSTRSNGKSEITPVC